ncbi:MAG: AAA family ATPase, partial [Gaiellales bacterium]
RVHERLPAGRLMRADELAALAGEVRGLAARCGTTTVLVIDGPSGSGKSTFATRLAEATGAGLLRLEDMYPGWDGLDEGTQRLVDDVLAPLARGEQATVRRWDWHAMRECEREPLNTAALLVVEGVGAGSRAAAPFVSLLIWLEADTEERYARAIARDGETYLGHWDRWAAQEQVTFAREGTRDRADRRCQTDDDAWQASWRPTSDA